MQQDPILLMLTFALAEFGPLTTRLCMGDCDHSPVAAHAFSGWYLVQRDKYG